MKNKRPYEQANAIAQSLLKYMEHMFIRLEIVGSLRRQAAMVGDIEFIGIPRSRQASLLGGSVIMQPYMVDDFMEDELLQVKKNGPKMKQFIFYTKNGTPYQIELYLQPNPRTWGVNKMIRTGSAEFSQWMVTDQSRGGAKPDHLQVRAGRVWDHSELVVSPCETPAERDVFNLWGLPFIEPQERSKGRWGQ